MEMRGQVTRKWVDTFVPEHSRTSCDDDNLNNAYGGFTGKYDENTGEKVVRFPRCVRCYLLDSVGCYFQDLEFKVNVEVYLGT